MSNNVGIDFTELGSPHSSKTGSTTQAAHGSNPGGYGTSPVKRAGCRK
ncbi:MAG: hypothetical protein M3044_05370 [Thermoproteota archaeon]|nr:hypothetical protein [Thermoproteota archaeon]